MSATYSSIQPFYWFGFITALLSFIGHRFTIRHDWSYVSLDILYCIPEDVGEYVCIAKNRIGLAETRPATLNVKARRAVDLSNQFPEGTEGVHQLQELEEHWNEM